MLPIYLYSQSPFIYKLHRKEEKEKDKHICQKHEKQLLSLRLKPAVQARGYRKEEARAEETFTFSS